jgi:hypothetical protein
MDYLPNADESRIGDWLQTYSGQCFWPLDPRPEEIELVDIAHALSMSCRYGGHCTRFYSVAEHSVLVSRHVPPEHALWGLLHDAAEAYSADVPRPLKRNLTGWKEIEARIMAAVCSRFDLSSQEPAEVKAVDLAITRDEQIALMSPCARDWGHLPPPVGADILGLSPNEAKALFLSRFAELKSDTAS